MYVCVCCVCVVCVCERENRGERQRDGQRERESAVSPLGLCPAALYPLLEEILIISVCSCAHREGPGRSCPVSALMKRGTR